MTSLIHKKPNIHNFLFFSNKIKKQLSICYQDDEVRYTYNTHVDYFRYKCVSAFDVRPCELRPENLDLVKYRQGVDGARAVLYARVDRLEIVELYRPIDAFERLVHGYFQPVGDARSEPVVITLHLHAVQLVGTNVLTDSIQNCENSRNKKQKRVCIGGERI